MKKIVGFICTHNSCRSQIAEGFAKVYGKADFDAYSAGTEKYHEIKPYAIEVMEEVGIDIKEQYPKLLDELPLKLDILITMGCGVVCPFIPNEHKEDWGLDDPSGSEIKEFRKTRDAIKEKVIDLISRINKGET